MFFRGCLPLFTVSAALFSAHSQAQQEFPARPLRMVVPFVAGGGSDFVARVLGQRLGESLGQQVVVEHRPGGGSVIASEVVVRSPPDGHTLYLAGTTFRSAPSLQKNLPFDPFNSSRRSSKAR